MIRFYKNRDKSETKIVKETATVEVKGDITNTFLKTVSAFANFMDGKIIFGISNDGEIKGIKNPTEACLSIENKINDSISPKPDFSLKVNPRTNVITLTVYEGMDKPYRYKGKAYRRSDTASVEVDHKELQRLTLLGEGRYFDGLPARVSSLTFHHLGEALKQKLEVADISTDILKTLNLYSERDGYNHAAELMADGNSFPGIDIARFGKSMDVILGRKQFTHQSVLLQFKNAVETYRTYYIYEEIDGVERKRREMIPEKAFREASANAIVHRQWDIDANIRVALFPDRIEIHSPGGLPFGVTKEDYLRGYVSVLRNPIIAAIFFRLRIIETFGTGIWRIRQAYSAYEAKPRFDITDSSVNVTLPIIEASRRVTSEQQMILNLFKGGRILSRAEVSTQCGMEKNKVLRLMNGLIENGYLKKMGVGRGTQYYIE